MSPGTRMTTGSWFSALVDQASIRRNSSPLVGARHTRFGMLDIIAMSNAPECVLSASEMPAPNTSSVAGVPVRASSCSWS